MTVEEALQERSKGLQKNRLDKFKRLNQEVIKGEILFTGSSLMEQFPIEEILMTRKLPLIIYNRGVGGFTTDDMLMNMEEMVFGTEPSKIFINIGTNDIGAVDFQKEKLLSNYQKILEQIRERLPETHVYLMAYYPVNEVDKIPEFWKDAFVNRNNKTIAEINPQIEMLAKTMGYDFIDVNQGLTDENGRLKAEYTVEGIHMYANAYRIIFDNMKVYLM